MILVVNNRDSFVFNLVRYVEELGGETCVVDGQTIGVDDIADMAPRGIIISPGPCTPQEAGVCVPLVKAFTWKVPMLGVCLGHQSIAAAFGWTIAPAKAPRYGQASAITHCRRALFEGLPSPLRAGLYHSLVALPRPGTPLQVDAVSPAGEVMALSHRYAPVFGVQFHPESILSEAGHHLLSNFLAMIRG